MSDEVWKALIASASTIAVAALAYFGAKNTKRAADNANADVVTPEEQESAAEAISNAAVSLIAPYRTEVAELRARVETAEGTAQEAVSEARRLGNEVARWQKIAKQLARSVVTLRSEVVRLGGHVDPEPEELTVLRVMGDIETTRGDLP